MEDQHSVYSVKNSFYNPVLESQSPQAPSCQPSDKLRGAARETTKQEYGRGLKIKNNTRENWKHLFALSHNARPGRKKMI